MKRVLSVRDLPAVVERVDDKSAVVAWSSRSRFLRSSPVSVTKRCMDSRKWLGGGGLLYFFFNNNSSRSNRPSVLRPRLSSGGEPEIASDVLRSSAVAPFPRGTSPPGRGSRCVHLLLELFVSRPTRGCISLPLLCVRVREGRGAI